jgi:hypothetical protein
MMSELFTFIRLGFRHITDLQGADHILFLLALAAIYRFHDWRSVLWVVTAFTVGHSLTLALAVTGPLRLPTPVIEFLIPVTIVVTGIENMLVRDRVREDRDRRRHYRPILAGLFGLVHGAGFANYLQSLFVEQVALPLFGFNVGIECGQLLVLALTFAAFAALDEIVTRVRPQTWRLAPLRLRTLAVSALVVVVAARWAMERAPW